MNGGEVGFLVVRQTGENQAVIGQYAELKLAQEVAAKLNEAEPKKPEQVTMTVPYGQTYSYAIRPAIYVVVGAVGFKDDIIGWYRALIKKGWPR